MVEWEGRCGGLLLLGGFSLNLMGLQHCHCLLHLQGVFVNWDPLKKFKLVVNLKRLSEDFVYQSTVYFERQVEYRKYALTFPCRLAGSSSMWRSSELSISRSIPVIFPARSACWR